MVNRKKASKNKRKYSESNFSIKKSFENNKYLTIAITVLLLSIAMFYSYDFRDDSASLEITNNWASQSIDNQIAQQAASVVNQQYPNLPAAQKNQRVVQEVERIKSQLGETYTSQVNQQGAAFRERLQREMADGSQQTYLLAIDPYYQIRKVENYLENGYPGDVLKDGKSWDTLMFAPIGAGSIMEFHIWFSAFWHKISSIFNPQIELWQSFFWVPVIISMLSVIPAFFIAYRKTNLTGGFIAAMVVAVHPYFLSRTAAGFSDTDPYQVFFPLLITWLIVEALVTKKFLNQLIFAGFAGIAVGIFAWAWVGWWYLLNFTLLAMAGTLWFKTTERIIDKNWFWYKKLSYLAGAIVLFPLVIGYFFYYLYIDFKKNSHLIENSLFTGLMSIVTFFVSSMIFVSLFVGFNQFMMFIKAPFGFTTLQNAAHANLWPNVFTTVAELNRAGINTIVGNIGFNTAGSFFFLMALIGIGLTYPGKKFESKDWIIIGSAVFFSVIVLQLLTEIFWFFALLMLPIFVGLYFILHRNLSPIFPILITVWFVGTIFASTLGIRFIILLVPAFAVALGIFAGRISQITEYFINTQLKIKSELKLLVSLAVLLVISLILLPIPVDAGKSVGQNQVPSFDDAWYASLKNLENVSSPDAIITSWWDFGHWFKATANRRVTFDGASQNSPQAHWVGRMLSANNDQESLGILRMLNCGAHHGELAILDNVNDSYKSIILTKKIILENRQDARKILIDEGISDAEVDRILNLTHCAPPESYVITSGDMVGKSGVWSHFGNWDFRKAFVYNALRNNPPGRASTIVQEGLGVSDEVAQSFILEARSLNEQEANNWIGPFAGYFGTQSFPCQNQNDTIVCTIGLGLGNSNANTANVLERVFFDTANVSNTTAVVGVYQNNGLGNQRVGEGTAKPSGIVFTGQDTLNRITFSGNTLGVDVIIDTRNNVAFVSNPQVSQSLFTRLYFLGGYGTEHFELVSDATSVFGNRILVWKVNWPEEFLD